MKRKPNCFIVGAPRCGTTSMYGYLKEHPRIYFPEFKEPHYFAVDFYPFRDDFIKDRSDYERLFDKASAEHEVLGEASTRYLYSSVAARKIYDYNPDSSIIVMVRNPVDMAQSLHSRLLRTNDEDVMDFEQAWKLQASRMRGEVIPGTCRIRDFVVYARVCRLGEQVERLLNVFPANQVKIVVMDDLSKDPSRVYEDVLAFLGVPSDGRKDFPRTNENREYKLEMFKYLFERPPRIVSNTTRRLKRLFGLQGVRLVSKKQRDYFMRRTRRKKLDPDLRREIAETFSDDIDKLAGILGRNLDSWKV